MSQNFQDVTLNTEISQGLDLLQKRDLTAATRSDSQVSFPTSPQEGHLFNHSGEKNVYAYVDGAWLKLWNYEFGAPYTINELNVGFQPINENLTNFSATAAAANVCFGFPQQTYTIAPKWLREYGKCEDKTEFVDANGIKNLAYLSRINGTADITDGTIPATAFAKDLETEVPREMSTGCVKRTFAPTWDTSKWLLMDGSTIGASVSNAKYRGDVYKKLFLSLGGTDGQWSSGQIVTLPDARYPAMIRSGEKYEETNVDFSFGFSLELHYRAGYANFETFTTTKDGEISFEIIAAGGGYAAERWKSGGKNYARAASGGGGECAVGTIRLAIGDKITVSVGSYGSGGGAGADSTIKFGNDEILRVKGGSSHNAATAGAGGTGGTVNSEKVTASFYRGHTGQNYFDVGVHSPLTMIGGSSGDPLNKCTDSPAGTHYAGNGLYVSASDPRRVGSGAGGILYSVYNPPHGGYCRLSDDNGVLNQTKNTEVIHCYFLIRV